MLGRRRFMSSTAKSEEGFMHEFLADISEVLNALLAFVLVGASMVIVAVQYGIDYLGVGL